MTYDPKKFRADLAQAGVNDLPKSGPWVEFAKLFDVGVLDLDSIAYYLNYDNGFKDVANAGPIALYTKYGNKFVDAIMDSSLVAHNLGRSKITQILDRIKAKDTRRDQEQW